MQSILHTLRTVPRAAVALLLALAMAGAGAVSRVNPFGVNVRSNGPTTVFLTFFDLDEGETAVEAFWCGELRADVTAADPALQLPLPVQTRNPCVSGSVYGRLPLQLDRSRVTRGATAAAFTDIMTIPASVARRAYQDAAAGAHSAFFYVRRFAGPAGERFVVVTCRMAGGGARVPLALMDVRLRFDGGRGGVTELAIARDGRLPQSGARLLYNGSGTLRGRWEVVQPGDPEPDVDDLLTAATLPADRRPLQRRWRVVERFELFLPPTGQAWLPGPDPARLPTGADGPHKVLLRIEASDDKEGQSVEAPGRVVVAGGVAGFPMPVLRYHVGAAGALPDPATAARAAALLVAPAPGAETGGAFSFSWSDGRDAAMLRLEVRAGADEVLAAYVAAGVGRYDAPPWFVEAQRGKTLRWRVLTLDRGGRVAAASDWRELSVR